jgi:hypothetical protein
MDCETMVVNGKMVVYLLSWFDGSNSHSYDLSDFYSSDSLIMKAISDLKKVKYHSHKVYLHNFSNFDSAILFNKLVAFG